MKAQHFKANFSITVTLISAATILCLEYLKKKKKTTCRICKTVEVKPYGHIHTVDEIVVNMQNGSVLLPALNVLKINKKKHGIATSDKVNRDPLQFVA